MSIRKWKKEFRKTHPLGWFEKNKHAWIGVGLCGSILTETIIERG
jgi:hypothetical protein